MALGSEDPLVRYWFGHGSPMWVRVLALAGVVIGAVGAALLGSGTVVAVAAGFALALVFQTIGLYVHRSR